MPTAPPEPSDFPSSSSPSPLELDGPRGVSPRPLFGGVTPDSPRLQALRDELDSLVALHECKRAFFCPVKSHRLRLLSNAAEHTLEFQRPPHRISLTHTAGVSHLRLAVHDQGSHGALSCNCPAFDCLPVLVKTLCGAPVPGL